jgi:hypothetical protein
LRRDGAIDHAAYDQRMGRPVAVSVVAAVALSVLVGSVPVSSAAVPAGAGRQLVEQLLDDRAQAVRSGDADSWLATVDERAIVEQGAQFEALDRLGFEQWSEQLTRLASGADGSWRAAVRVRYRFPGDRTDAVIDAVLDITPRLRVAGSTATAFVPWEMDGVSAASGRHSVVAGSAPDTVLRKYATELDRASVSVGRVLGDQPPRVVLLLPTDWDQAARMIPTSVGPGLAAATSELGAPGTVGGPARILALPGVLAHFDSATRMAVFGHETFHVAMHSSASQRTVPHWLSEGLADYVGYRESGIPMDRAVTGLLRYTKANGAPAALPDDAAFADPRRAGWAYEGAHVAVRMLVAEHGVADVVAMYRAVAGRGAAGMDAALQKILNTDLADVTASWRAEVNALAVS